MLKVESLVSFTFNFQLINFQLKVLFVGFERIYIVEYNFLII